MAELELSYMCELLRRPERAIAFSENFYHGEIDAIARSVISHPTIRIMLLSGPSGSGKTTTANLIRDKIRSLGEPCEVISLDNFYRNHNDAEYPRLDNGERDLESPEALDTGLLLSVISDIVAGRKFSVPRYDFKLAMRTGFTEYESFSEGCVIIEGIHALNPILSNPFPKSSVIKVFVSVSTNINENGKRVLSGKKARFVRRLVRDSIYRAASAEKTLSLWKNVLLGEEKHLYPYKELADVKLDTFHIFELSVMKKYAQALLDKSSVRENGYVIAVLAALDKIPQIEESLVPTNSLIREFIPGGIYEELY